MAEGDADVWAGERVARWLRQSAALEAQLAPVADVLFAAADLQPGEAVLDVGCGAGPTTGIAARAVGPAGRVVGLDISADMLAAAAQAVTEPNVTWLQADVATWEPEEAAFDVVLSRFGVMFSTDAAGAFAHLAAAARPGGRLAIVTWQRRDASELFAVPLHAAAAVVRASGARSDAEVDRFLATDDQGAFSLHGAEVLVHLLERAGWHDIVVAPHRLPLPPASDLRGEARARSLGQLGPTRLLLEGLPDEVVAQAEAAILDELTAREAADGSVLLVGAVNVTTATR